LHLVLRVHDFRKGCVLGQCTWNQKIRTQATALGAGAAPRPAPFTSCWCLLPSNQAPRDRWPPQPTQGQGSVPILSSWSCPVTRFGLSLGSKGPRGAEVLERDSEDSRTAGTGAPEEPGLVPRVAGQVLTLPRLLALFFLLFDL
jgi:hypothetical protein